MPLINNKRHSAPLYKLGQEVYTVDNCDSDSRWVCRRKIIAYFPSLIDIISLDNKTKKYEECNYYETRFIDTELNDSPDGKHIGPSGLDTGDAFRGEDMLFESADEALTEAYKQIEKEWEDEK